jgi:hypothetical protein
VVASPLRTRAGYQQSLETNRIISIITLLVVLFKICIWIRPVPVPQCRSRRGNHQRQQIRPPASDPSGTTPSVKRRKIDYLTENVPKDLGIPNGTLLACESIQSTLGIRYTCICEEKLCLLHKPDASRWERRGSCEHFRGDSRSSGVSHLASYRMVLMPAA